MGVGGGVHRLNKNDKERGEEALIQAAPSLRPRTVLCQGSRST